MRSNQDERSTFADALTRAYLRDPCGVLPNALWKSLREIEACQTAIVGTASDPEGLEMWDRKRLLVPWRRDGTASERVRKLVRTVDLALIHDRMIGGLEVARFSSQVRHTRLAHRLPATDTTLLQEAYGIAEARIPDEAPAISSFLGACYEGLKMPPETVLSWAEHPTHDSSLWIWIKHLPSGLSTALGIAEHDAEIGEISLEWIQVHPDYRRRGLGRALVFELLSRASKIGHFATVSGFSDAPAESLYRSCGFAGNDVWWCLRR